MELGVRSEEGDGGVGLGVRLVGRGEKGELQEGRVACASAQGMECVALYECACARVWQVGMGRLHIYSATYAWISQHHL